MFGVNFSSITITEVRFKPQLQQTLQETTNFKAKIKEQIKMQKNKMDEIVFRKDREMQELSQQNTRIIQDLQAQRTRVEIDRKKRETDALSRAEVQQTAAKEQATINEVRARSEKTVAENQGRKKKEEILAQAESTAAAMRIGVDQQCSNEIYEAEQALIAARSEAQAIMVEAKAENIAKDKLMAKRQHQLQMLKLNAMCAMAKSSKVIMSGSVGDSIIKEIAGDDIMSQIKLRL